MKSMPDEPRPVDDFMDDDPMDYICMLCGLEGPPEEFGCGFYCRECAYEDGFDA